MDCWEYQVIHINVEPPKPSVPPPGTDPPSGQAPGPADAGSAKPVFSENFLKKEFPQFYEKPAEGSAGQSQHPAQQLQTFLNGHGSKGWELVGVFPVGNLTMMFFRRPKPASPESPVAQTVPIDGTLQGVISRLEALEQQLSGPQPIDAPIVDTATAPASSGRRQRRRSSASPEVPSVPAQQGTTPPSSAVELVTAAQLASLAGETPVPSSVAAQAIGLRSATSLANHGARYGYNPGLSKVGPNGMVAIYTGPGAAETGGKERRLWIVVRPERLGG
jgi:hypothetical protein